MKNPLMAFGYPVAASVMLMLAIPPRAEAQTLSPLSTCAEVPASAVGITARRKAVRTDCSAKQAESHAALAARANAANDLAPTCRAQITRAEAEAACAVHGRTLATNQPHGGMSTTEGLALPGSASIDAAIAVGSTRAARVCVAIRDLPQESEATSQSDAVCIFDGFKRTLFTARARGRCGVQCL
jgi:hypothetical protein